ncbi:hypothetical protein [Streptomyces sp. NPDC006640]|uniref:hypothetical protein n=1 Tax=unclassified Streptomyces TaxID=2593676 RepID=UPI0036A9F289
MDSHSVSDRISASAAMLIVGVIADVSAAAFFLASSDTRVWLKGRYMWLAVAGLLLIAVILALLNRLYSHSARISELHNVVSAMESRLAGPSRNDVEMFRTINRYVSPQSGLMVWLRDGFLETRVREIELDALHGFLAFFEREPRGFVDVEIEGHYRRFLTSCRALSNLMAQYFHPNPRTEWYVMPIDWEFVQPEIMRDAIRQINTEHDAVMEAYDALLRAAQRKNFESGIEGLAAGT